MEDEYDYEDCIEVHYEDDIEFELLTTQDSFSKERLVNSLVKIMPFMFLFYCFALTNKLSCSATVVLSLTAL